MAQKRKPGISVLIATQNEEALVSLCLRSFLDFGDELVVVDNGSTDQTIEIVSDLASRYPDKIRFFNRPELPDLYHNRQFALEQSRYEWIMRADSDFVAYTAGEYNIENLRTFLLSRKRKIRPEAVRVIMSNVVGDFWHTGIPLPAGEVEANPERICTLGPVVRPTMRFYRHYPWLRFVRRGSLELVRFWRVMKRITWDTPLWMHCNIKSDMNYFFRSKRNDWRKLRNFKKYPTLVSYIEDTVMNEYGTSDLPEAARLYMERNVYTYLQPYDPKRFHSYPSLVLQQMEKNPIYKIFQDEGRLKRKYLGIDFSRGKNE